MFFFFPSHCFKRVIESKQIFVSNYIPLEKARRKRFISKTQDKCSAMAIVTYSCVREK